MATTSLAERLARTKQHQARALAGEQTVLAPRQAANETLHDFIESPAHGIEFEREVDRVGLMLEFDRLVPVVAPHLGYEGGELAELRSFVGASDRELALCVYQWWLDAVTYELDDELPESTATRARIWFRQSVMRQVVDENGVPYRADALNIPRPIPEASAAKIAGAAPRP